MGSERRPGDRLTVAQVIASMAVGGSQHQAVTLVNRLDRSRFRPLLVCFTPGPQLDRVQSDVEVLCLGQPVSLSIRGLWRAALSGARLLRIFRLVRPDVVHTSMPASNLLGCVAAWLAGVPRRFAHVRGSARQFSYSYAPVQKRHSRWRQRALFARFMAIDIVTSWFATRMVAVSDETRDVLGRFIPRRRIVVVPNGVDLELFRPVANGALRERLGIPAGVSVVTNIGNISFYKGQEFLVEAVPVIAAAHPEVVILIVGKGSETYEAMLRRRCAELGVERRVRFLGEVVSSRDILAITDVKVLCSQYEGCPNVLLEAMAMGVPIVATRVGGNPELVEQGVNGFLVPPEDPPGLAAAVVELLASPERRRTMGANGRRLAKERFGLEQMVGRIEALYDGSVGRHRHA